LLGIAALAAAAWGLAPLGCSSNSTTGTGGGTSCEGGYLRMVDGGTPTCEGLCKASLCTEANNICVNNDCALQCTSDAECQLQQNCAPAKEDGTGMAVTTCQANGLAAIGTSCPFGNECANIKACNDGTPCMADTDCKMGGTCQALTCLTAGSGDADAYCTLKDCQTDANCPGGYWCDTVRDPHQICGKPKPNPSVCGTTSDPCVDPSMDMANGTTYEPGQFCTQRNECVKRSQCSPCTTDVDCSFIAAGAHCTQGSCALDCGSDADCVNGFHCTSGSCVPRAGSCAPAQPGTGAICSPCRVQADCGTGLICEELELGGFRACLYTGAATCTSDGQCPKTVTGLHLFCADASGQPVQAGETGTCGPAPYFPATLSLDCWCANKGAPCLLPSDCCGGACFGADPVNMVPGVCSK
jgi:hypothetical protein